MPDLLPGAEIAGCRIEAVAGRGGMGIVYRATQLSLGRPVAVKLITPDRAGDPGFRERFERESRLAAAIDHPNVVPVYAAGEEEGRLYIVMRYVAGTDLQALLAGERRLDPRRAAAIVAQVGAALDAAHAAGLVHRDIKPANVLLDGEHAYLADFGLSRPLAAEMDARMTTTGHWIGTVDFMAPEQFQGSHVDARADVYALGCVLHAALTGAAPFHRGTVPATMLAHLHDPAPRPSTLATGVPDGFDRVIARALAKDQADRYPSAGDLGRAAQAAAEGHPITEAERTVARGAAAPAGNGTPASLGPGEAPTALLHEPTATQARETPPAPRRRRPSPRRALALTILVALAAIVMLRPDAGPSAAELPGAPVAQGEVEALARAFARAYEQEDVAALERLFTGEVERVLPAGRQRGETAVVDAYRAQFTDSETHRFELSGLATVGGGAGRASARYRVRYVGEPDATGTIVLGVRRERGRPRIALVAATPGG